MGSLSRLGGWVQSDGFGELLVRQMNPSFLLHDAVDVCDSGHGSGVSSGRVLVIAISPVSAMNLLVSRSSLALPALLGGLAARAGGAGVMIGTYG